MTSGGFTAAYIDIVPMFERTTGHTVVTTFGGSMGSGPETIPNRLQRGEPADVVIMASSALDELVRQGHVVAGSRVDLVRSTIGMAVRAGAPRPDISTVAALKETLLRATSIGYSASASGVYLSTELFQRLGIADRVLPKSRNAQGERVAALVARGEVEIGFQQVSELLPEPGVDYVGPLPADVQRVTVFSAGIVSGARSPVVGRALIDFLASERARPAIEKWGLEPAASAQPRTAQAPGSSAQRVRPAPRHQTIFTVDWSTWDERSTRKLGPVTFATPAMRGEMVRVVVPIGDILTRAARGVSASRQQRRQERARREVQHEIRAFVARRP
jgi:molybdate transport system substrate-binding protein